jgi:hypothetical protein
MTTNIGKIECRIVRGWTSLLRLPLDDVFSLDCFRAIMINCLLLYVKPLTINVDYSSPCRFISQRSND